MSSILEALRELESRRPPTSQSIAVPAEQPAAVSRAAEVIGIVSIGLVLGALAFLLIIALSGAFRAFAARERPAPAVTVAAEAPSSPAAAEAPSSPARPAWLETADPPRARVEQTVPAPARAVAVERPVRVAKAVVESSSEIEVTDIDYSADAARRAVTLRLDGSVVRLHERQSEQGIEVQSIQPDGVYVRRGGDVFMVSPTR